MSQSPHFSNEWNILENILSQVEDMQDILNLFVRKRQVKKEGTDIASLPAVFRMFISISEMLDICS